MGQAVEPDPHGEGRINVAHDWDVLTEVRAYYDRSTEAYLRCMGMSLQGGRICLSGDDPDERSSNLYLAARADLRPGQRVLDAGCGVCGPSMDIASAIPNLRIDAITISPVQAGLAKRFIAEHGLTQHIKICVGDYHCLPFADECFDRVVFFESSEHSYDRLRLFREAHRVLKPSGRLYIKAVFIEDRPLDAGERQVLAEGQKLYALRLSTLAETTAAVVQAGFSSMRSCALDDIISTRHYAQAMVTGEPGDTRFTELGRLHIRPTTMHLRSPVHYGEVKAIKLTGVQSREGS